MDSILIEPRIMEAVDGGITIFLKFGKLAVSMIPNTISEVLGIFESSIPKYENCVQSFQLLKNIQP